MKGREVFDNIPEEVCRELEAIVGPDHVTTDPNIRMSSYGFGYGHEIYWFQGGGAASRGYCLTQDHRGSRRDS